MMLPEKRRKIRPRPWNPLARDEAALAQSSCHGVVDSRLMRLFPDYDYAPADAETVHEEMRRTILGQGYPCVGSRSVFNQETYRLGLYDELGSGADVRGVCHDIYEFSWRFRHHKSRFFSMIACFRGPEIRSELHFEELLWKQLAHIHELDRELFTWDGSVSSDPASEHFSFSIGGKGFFVVGLHPRASRPARVFGLPILIFNLHEQFERLRERGKYDTMRNRIRERDLAFSGSINPVVADHGASSEARQYSGRAVPANWRCPLHPGKDDEH